MTQITSAALWPERNVSQSAKLGVWVLVSPGVVELRDVGVPAASLLSDGVGGYDLTDATLAGTGTVAVIGTTGVIY